MRRILPIAAAAACLAGPLALVGSAGAAQQAPPGGAPQAPRRLPPVASDAEPRPAIRGQNLNGLRVYIRSGMKTHGSTDHDYPQFLADWAKVLTEQGALVDGSYHAPTAQELANVDVLLIYKGDAGYMSKEEKAALDAFVKRGGGIVAIHDSVCGPNPPETASYVGGGKRHGERNTQNGQITYTVTDPASPIMKDFPNGFSFPDEANYGLTMATTGVKVLATHQLPDNAGTQANGVAGQVVPQIWTYEHTVADGQPARAFVWNQGHTRESFAMPALRNMLLRGIAWAGKRPVDELVDYKPPPAPPREPRPPGA
jgi:type 1 glutamine amidotransferase